ncbi:antigen peptide transporter 2-like [Chelonoidis abingdonii]|uniref:antigen peptide transporter 2-like n=1 Tax=Chelonoidis abingdonii TaxID=106734 RepID=UPI003F4969BA
MHGVFLPVPPEVSVSCRDAPDSSIILSCRARGFYPRPIHVSWVQDGEDILAETDSSGILPNADGTYYTQSSLEISLQQQDGHRYACRVEHSSLGEPTLVWAPGKKGPLPPGVLAAIVLTVLVLAGAVGAGVILWRRKSAGPYALAASPKGTYSEAATPCSSATPYPHPSRPDRQVLKAVSFELRPGEVTALVGLNGSGKTTCVGLLERFYEPQAGEILLDGAPIREYDHRYLHRQVALVGQEPVLFSGSIRENIAYGLGGCGEEQVTRAARAAHASGFIMELDSGFETDVGEKGGQLSAGQKQRIAIARALIRQPAVLILDEATSALDTESECAIHQSVLSQGPWTVLVIAHRMQTVENADRIVVLEGGAVAEEGTHAELMGRKGPYYRLVQRDLAE